MYGFVIQLIYRDPAHCLITLMIKSTIVLTIGNLLSSSGHGQANVKTRTQASHIIFYSSNDQDHLLI